MRAREGETIATRTRLGPLAIVAALALTVASCGTVPNMTTLPAVSPTVTVPAGMPIVLTVAGRFEDTALAVLDQQIAAFEAANPDVRVELVQAPRTAAERRLEMIDTLQDEDAGVDIVALDLQWLSEFAAAGRLEPLDDRLLAADIEPAAFLPAAIQASTVGGHLVALPWAMDAGVLYYRDDLLTSSGLGLPATWPDVQRLALDLKARAGLPAGMEWPGAANETLTCVALEFIWANGGQVLDEAGQVAFDSPQTRAGLQQMLDFLASGASPAEVVDYRENDALDAFRDGKAALMRNWTYAWSRANQPGSAVAGHVGVAPLPASCLAGQALALPVHGLHKPEAMRFLAFLTAYDQQIQLAQQAGLPPALAAAFDAPALAATGGWGELYTVLAAARPRPMTPAYAVLSPIIYTEVHRMLAGEQDAATTAVNIQRQAESAIHPGETP